MDYFLLIFYLLLAILISFLCSILEAVLLSITPSFAEATAQKNPVLGNKLKKLKKDIDKPLSAILSLNTIAHTVGAAGVGAQAASIWGNEILGVVSGVLTLLILIFSEIIPKTLGASYWKKLVGFTARTLQILVIGLYPLVWLSQILTKIMASKEKENSISRAEISALADVGHKEGVFAENESRIIKNLIKLKNVQTKDIMTPRTVAMAVKADMPLGDIYKNKQNLRFSRLLVYQNQIDDASGFIHKHDILYNLADDKHELKVKDILREVPFLQGVTPVTQLFSKFVQKRTHIAIVVDEYGGLAGLVTMEDVLETLLGLEIVDEFDSTQDMQSYARELWLERAKKLNIITLDDNPKKE